SWSLGSSLRLLSGTAGALPVRTLVVIAHDGSQGELAAGVDLLELDLDLLSHAQHILDGIYALAPDELADLRDVQQAVLARKQGDERTEGGGLDHGAQETLSDLRHLRVGDRVHRSAGSLGRGTVGRA